MEQRSDLVEIDEDLVDTRTVELVEPDVLVGRP
jgi:hypothetical protein